METPVVPMLHLVQVLLPNGTQLTFTNSLSTDPILGLEVDVDRLLR